MQKIEVTKANGKTFTAKIKEGATADQIETLRYTFLCDHTVRMVRVV